MATYNENVDINGTLEVERGWSDWIFLRQARNSGGGGGFVIHNPWGNSTQPQGAASRNRLEIGYRHASGQMRWGQFVIHGPSGNVGIGRVDPRARLDVAGDVVVSGDIRLANADCAEDFESVDARVEPGAVMVLTDDGRVSVSVGAYDRRVAGVVAGAGDLAPAIRLGHIAASTSSRVPVALLGRVNCWVDAKPGPVEVGDLLTTAETPGCAMRAEDPARSFGAVLGKALEPLRTGVGLIPVLVALQ